MNPPLKCYCAEKCKGFCRATGGAGSAGTSTGEGCTYSPIQPTTEPITSAVSEMEQSQQKKDVDHLRNMQLDNLELSSKIPFTTPPVEGESNETQNNELNSSGSTKETGLLDSVEGEWEKELARIHYEPEHQEGLGGLCWCNPVHKTEGENHVIDHIANRDVIKSFITTLLHSERAKERERIVKMIDEAQQTGQWRLNATLSSLRDKLSTI